ncbi:MAG: Uma2 family endonuclease, partial [Acidimicrobiales bacterium]
VLVEPATRTVTGSRSSGGTNQRVEASGLIEFGPGALAEQIDWRRPSATEAPYATASARPASPAPLIGRQERANLSVGTIAGVMATLVLGSPPPELKALAERRRRAGVDRLDEVWQGVLHMVPGPSSEHARISHRLAVLLDGPARAAGLVPAMSDFNLGTSEDDFRVPDGGLLRPGQSGVWLSTVPMVIEILSPGDESWQKLPFYAEHHVDEVVLVDPATRTVTWLALVGGEYQRVEASALIELGPDALAEQIDWP